jgi:adenylosuccinate lyase
VVVPDSTTLLDYMLNKMVNIVDKLVVNPDVMLKNMEKTRGIIFSQRVLLALIDKGLTRQEAYDMVQGSAMGLTADGPDFKQILVSDSEVRRYLSESEVNDCFDMKYHLKYVDRIFKKTGI